MSAQPNFEESFEIRLARLSVDLLRLDMDNSFSSTRAESIIDVISSLLAQFPDRTHQSQLATRMMTAVKNFAMAGRWDYVSRISGLAPEFMLEIAPFVSLMTNIYALAVLDDPNAPASWRMPNGNMAGDLAEYRKYVAASARVGYPELILLYDMLIGHVEQRPDQEIRSWIHQNLELQEADRDNYVHLLQGYAEVSSDQDSGLAGERVRDFLCEYQSDNLLLRTAAAGANIDCTAFDPVESLTSDES